MDIYNQTYLPVLLHDISQGLLVPTMACIVALILVSIFFVGRVLVEYFTEHRYFKQNAATIVNQINDATYQNVTDVICASQLLRFQKSALIVVSKNMGLPEESLFSLAQMEIGQAEKLYKNRLAWTDTLSKIAPLLGLMGTLIPLGPGIVALGQNDTLALSQSLLLAFDATVCGLVCAILALIVSKVRSGWYSRYIEVLESVMSCVVDKAAQARKDGVELPANYTGDPLKEFQLADKAAKEAEAAKAKAAKTDDPAQSDAPAKADASVESASEGA